MMSEPGSSTERFHLERIRDNQRRSRARRKEHVQELEAKYRACQQLGVEASAEIQAAARKVLDENRRLRELLQVKGIPDAEVESFVSQGAHTPTEFVPSGPTTQLNALLETRKPCRPQADSRGGERVGSGPVSASSSRLLQPQLEPAAHSKDQKPLIVADPTPLLPTEAPTGPLIQPDTQAPPLNPLDTHFPAESAAAPPPLSTFEFAPNEPWIPQLEPLMGDVGEGDDSSMPCNEAHSIVRAMTSADCSGPDVVLCGCGPGQVCQVPTRLVFAYMDQYLARL